MLATLLSFGLAACSVTQKAHVLDDRPLVMFENAQPEDIVLIDGVELGFAKDFKAEQSALIIEPGTHMLKVVRNGLPLLEQQFYISRGAAKVFGVPGL